MSDEPKTAAQHNFPLVGAHTFTPKAPEGVSSSGSQCPTGRKRFGSFTEASNYLKSAKLVVGAPVAVEKCEHCNGWHLVKSDKRAFER